MAKILLFLCLLFPVGYAWDLDQRPNQVHLSYGETSADMYVTWNTYAPTKTSAVLYGNKLNYMTALGSQTKFTTGNNTQYVHRAVMSKLQTDTSYLYRVGDDSGGWSDVFEFTSIGCQSPKLAVYGDMGLENAKSLPYLKEMAQDGKFDAVLHVGDFAYDMHDENGAVGDKFMNKIQSIAAYVPYMTSVGNHESYQNYSNYKNRFTMPTATANNNKNFYYNFTLGDACFISYSTEFYFTDIKAALVQFEWLNKTLQAQNCPWLITFGHRPMYCSNSDHDDCTKVFSIIRLALEQLFYDNNVDIAIAAHEHSFEVTTRMFNNKTDPNGIYHIVSGSAGCREDHDPFRHHNNPWSVFRSIDYGYGIMEITNSTHINWKQYSVDTREAELRSVFGGGGTPPYPQKVIYEQWFTK
jgi:hypothetical protein